MLFSFVLIFFMSSGHVNESIAAFMNVFNIKIDKIRSGPVISHQIIILITVGIVGLIGIRRR